MKILVIGEQEHLAEAKKKLGDQHVYTLIGDHLDGESFLDQHDVVFDFVIDEEPDQFEIYANKSITVFLNTCKITLSELAHMVDFEFMCTAFGFNGMPTLFNRALLEVSLMNKNDEEKLRKCCTQLGSEYTIVDDRIGLVTPRVISMIINEAYYTFQEGTATKEDIDLAMKLGTNYPHGPFEWCQRIGIKHVYELLEAVYEDTKDERYKICPLLKKEYLKEG
jgi:3-hydroxybutyryl-CoA dehydrogenase